MIAEILCVGTELLMGQVLNSNAQFIARRLAALGITHYHQTVVGDNVERLEAAYRLALSRADVVITSGGLGPTVDDITKRAAAKAAGKELVLRPEAEAMVRDMFARMHPGAQLTQLGQAMFTADSELLPNRCGTAPGAIVPMGGGKVVIHLPGPPRELQPMFTEQVEPWLCMRSDRILASRYVYIFGMPESAVDAQLHDLEEAENPTLSPYCSTGEVVLRATAAAANEKAAAAMLTPLLNEIKTRLGDAVYDVREDDHGSLAEAAVSLLKQHNISIATCESLTGGLIAATMVEVPGASQVVKGGFVTYWSQAKTELAGVPAEMIEQYDVVSAEVARAMAEGTRERMQVDIAVSATGLAGPGGGTPERPVGTVFVGISTRERTFALELHLSGDRMRVRTLTVKHALNAVRCEALRLTAQS